MSIAMTTPGFITESDPDPERLASFRECAPIALDTKLRFRAIGWTCPPSSIRTSETPTPTRIGSGPEQAAWPRSETRTGPQSGVRSHRSRIALLEQAVLHDGSEIAAQPELPAPFIRRDRFDRPSLDQLGKHPGQQIASLLEGSPLHRACSVRTRAMIRARAGRGQESTFGCNRDLSLRAYPPATSRVRPRGSPGSAAGAGPPPCDTP